MRNKTLWITLAVGIVMGLTAGLALAGDPANPPGPPETTQSYTLEDIYQRLDTGAEASKSAFTEPASGPETGTMHTITEIYERIGSLGVYQTGQTTSYDTRDDGALQAGLPHPTPRFTDNGDGTVTDNSTHLIWLKNANCFGTKAWAEALASANGLASGSCGLTDGSSAGDWRLPNVRELRSLIDYSNHHPALPSDHPFASVQSASYWSSTTHADYSSSAWRVPMGYGALVGNPKNNTYYVWPVRGGQ